MGVVWRGQCAICRRTTLLGSYDRPVPCADCWVKLSKEDKDCWIAGIDPTLIIMDWLIEKVIAGGLAITMGAYRLFRNPKHPSKEK